MHEIPILATESLFIICIGTVITGDVSKNYTPSVKLLDIVLNTKYINS